MPVAVVTGANSGIGHAFAQVLVKDGYQVHAADLHVGDNIKSLGCSYYQLDVTSPQSIHSFAAQLKDKAVDLLLNIAGTMLDGRKDALETITLDILEQTFAVNTYGPLLLTQALLPNVLKSEQPKLGYMSSRMGSIEDNSTGGNYAYRASKAALNSCCKSMAAELKDKGVVVVILHPGIVKTPLAAAIEGPVPPGAVEPEEAASKLYKVLLSKDIADTGKFWHREGQELPW